MSPLCFEAKVPDDMSPGQRPLVPSALVIFSACLPSEKPFRKWGQSEPPRWTVACQKRSVAAGHLHPGHDDEDAELQHHPPRAPAGGAHAQLDAGAPGTPRQGDCCRQCRKPSSQPCVLPSVHSCIMGGGGEVLTAVPMGLAVLAGPPQDIRHVWSAPSTQAAVAPARRSKPPAGLARLDFDAAARTSRS